MYQRALREGQPAYDASWMWAELGLDDATRKLPPPLAHERLATFAEGAGELLSSLAEAARKRPGFEDKSTVLDEAACRELLDLQRFLKAHPAASEADDVPSWRRRELLPYLRLGLNFAVHRRKAFWVDEPLSYMLAQTDVDVVGSELRAPFASMALVFTDRHVLSLGERLLARQRGCPLAGLLLQVVTVYLTESVDYEHRTLQITFAFDAGGDDLPELVPHTLSYGEDTPIQNLFPQDDQVHLVEPPIKTTSPMHGLLQVVSNALLYATSAGVEPELRAATPTRAKPKGKASQQRPVTSESVYFLPGSIDISQARRLESLARVGEGRESLRRFMVRGHWRRPAKNWSDTRMRWIAPYWKGPDLAAVIERVYRLKP